MDGRWPAGSIIVVVLFSALLFGCATSRPVEQRSECGSIGKPGDGELHCGVRLASGDGFHVQDPREAWGTPLTLEVFIQAVAETRRAFPDAPDLLVGDISSKYGGKLDGHSSHQSGRDMDVGFYHEDGKAHQVFFEGDAATIDLPKTWFFLETLLESGKVEYVFLDYDLQRVFYDYLAPAYPPYKLHKWFQYPRPKSERAGIVRYSPGHGNHFHIRIYCPPEDKECVD